WVDETQFDLEYHVRHTALPAPGGETELKKLVGRLFSQALDRDKPLWEMWLVEALGESRFAIVSKTHHCMLDGVSGVDLATVLMDRRPDPSPPPAPAPWKPRKAPKTADLLVLVPVSMRSRKARGTYGNQVSAVFCTLPLTEPDPVQRLRKVHAAMMTAMKSGSAVGAHALSRLGDFAPPQLLAQAARLQA